MFSKLVRLGKDAEMASTPAGKQVCKIVAAYDVGWGDNKKTVWVDGSWWGDRGSKVAQYLTKGTQVVIHADDVEPDAYQSKNGLSVKLKMNITNVELVAREKQSQPDYAQQGYAPQQPQKQPAPQQYQQPAPGPQYSPNSAVPHAASYQPVPQTSASFPDFDDDIPFMRLDSTFAI